MSRRRWLALGAAGVALALVLGGVSLAKTSPAGDKKADRAKYASLYRERLAARLGVGAAALDAARKGALEDVIAQALKDGTITPTQAAQLRERLSEGLDEGLHFGWLFGKHNGRQHAATAKGRVMHAAVDAVLHKLGMTMGDLKRALHSGVSFAQIAREHGTSLAELGKIAAGAAKPILDEMVKAGEITQARADEWMQRLRSGEILMHHRGARKAA